MSFQPKTNNKVNKYDSLILENKKDLFLYVKSGDLNKIRTLITNFPKNCNIIDENEESLVTTLLNSEEIKTEEKKLVILKLLNVGDIDLFISNKFNQHIIHLVLKNKYVNIWKYLITNELIVPSTLSDPDIFQVTPIQYLFYQDINKLLCVKDIIQEDLKFLHLPTDLNNDAKNQLNLLLQDLIYEINNSTFKKKLIPLFKELPRYHYLSMFDSISKLIIEKKDQVFQQLSKQLTNSNSNSAELSELIYTKDKGVNPQIDKEIFSGAIEELKQYNRNFFKADWKFLEPNEYQQNYSEAREKYLNSFFNGIKFDNELGNLVDTQSKLNDFQKNIRETHVEYIRTQVMSIPSTLPSTLDTFDIYLTHPKAIIPRGNIISLGPERFFIKSDNSVIIGKYLVDIINTLLTTPTNMTNIQIISLIYEKSSNPTTLDIPKLETLFGNKANFTSISTFVDTVIIALPDNNSRCFFLILLCLKHNLSTADIIFAFDYLFSTDTTGIEFMKEVVKRLKTFDLSREELYYCIIYYVFIPTSIDIKELNTATVESPITSQTQNQIIQNYFKQEVYLRFNPLFTLLYEFFTQKNKSLLKTFKSKTKNGVLQNGTSLVEVLEKLLNSSKIDYLIDIINDLEDKIKTVKNYNAEKSDIENIMELIKINHNNIHNDTLFTIKQVIISELNLLSDKTEIIDRAFFDPYILTQNVIDYFVNIYSTTVSTEEFCTTLVALTLNMYTGGPQLINSSSVTNRNQYFIVYFISRLLINKKINESDVTELIGFIDTGIYKINKDIVKHLYHSNMLVSTLANELGIHPKYAVLIDNILDMFNKNKNAEEILSSFFTVLYSQMLDCKYLGTTSNLVTNLFLQKGKSGKKGTEPPDVNIDKSTFGLFGMFFDGAKGNIDQSNKAITVAPSRFDSCIYNLISNLTKTIDNIIVIIKNLYELIKDFQTNKVIDVASIRITLLNGLNLEIGKLKFLYNLYQNETSNYIFSANKIITFVKDSVIQKLIDDPNNMYSLSKELTEFNKIVDAILQIQSKPVQTLRTNEGTSGVLIPLKKSLDELTKEENSSLDKICMTLLKVFNVINGLMYWEDKHHSLNRYVIESLDKINHKVIIFDEKASVNYYTSFEITKTRQHPEILSSGDILMGIIKEDIIENILLYRIKKKTKLNYELISKMMSDYLIYLSKFYLHEIVKKKYSNIFYGGDVNNMVDLTFYPQLKIDTTNLKTIYINHSLLSKSISYKISMDIISNVSDWEFNQSFVVVDNEKIINIIDSNEELFFNSCTNFNVSFRVLLVHDINIDLLNEYIDYIDSNDAINVINNELTFFMSQYFTSTDLNTITDFFVTTIVTEMITSYSSENLPIIDDIDIPNNSIIYQYKKFIEDIVNYLYFDELLKDTPNENFIKIFYETYYKVDSQDCILKKNSKYYSHVVNKIKDIIRDIWVVNFEFMYKEILNRYQMTPPSYSLPDDLESTLIMIILKYPMESVDLDLDTLFEKIKYSLNVSHDKVNQLLEEKIFPYFKKVAITLLTDLRTLATNIMRLALHLVLHKYMIIICKNKP
jgi:hypothetical protein